MPGYWFRNKKVFYPFKISVFFHDKVKRIQRFFLVAVV